MAARNKRNRHRRRRGRFGFLYKLLSFLLIFAAILAGCVAFFRVNQVTVTGNSRYTAEEIVAASGVNTGDNLFLVNKPQTAQSIIRRLPYVEKVAPVRVLPDTLELRVTETSAVAAVQAEGNWWLMNAGGKLLDQGDASLQAVFPQVIGLHPVTPSVGVRRTVPLEEQTKRDSLRSLLTALSERGMTGNVTGFIDLTSNNAIYFGYGGDLTVAMPLTGNFNEQAFRLQRVMESFQQRGEAVAGTLDLTYEGKQARLLTSRWMPEDGWDAPAQQDQEGGSQDGQPQQSDAPEPGADAPEPSVVPEPPSIQD